MVKHFALPAFVHLSLYITFGSVPDPHHVAVEAFAIVMFAVAEQLFAHQTKDSPPE